MPLLKTARRAKARHSVALTACLVQALALAVEDDDVYPESNLYRPSIAEHSQNPDQAGWTHVIGSGP